MMMMIIIIVVVGYFKPFDYEQSNDYYKIVIVTLNRIMVNKLFMIDKNT